MLIIINDDPVYVSWITHHRQGYVLDTTRKPSKRHLVLHRATCSIIKPHKRARLTTGAHVKACSLDIKELCAWALEQTGGKPQECPDCQPQHEKSARAENARPKLTRLGEEIVSYVLDLAVLYLDGREWHYGPTLPAVATYLDKTPKQILSAAGRAFESGHLASEPPIKNGTPSTRAILYPTEKALRTLPAFNAMSGRALAKELARLKERRDRAG